MDQLICASLSHTHFWCEEGILRVPAVYNVVNFSPTFPCSLLQLDWMYSNYKKYFLASFLVNTLLDILLFLCPIIIIIIQREH